MIDPARWRITLACCLSGEHAMTSYNLAPLYRSSVGFDRLFSMLDQMGGGDAPTPSYPPYNIEKLDEDSYRITLAVAGFSAAEIEIESHENSLSVRGTKAAPGETGQFLFHGIAARAFERRFHLADYVRVTSAHLEHGLLHIALMREVPEAKKARIIPIGASEPADHSKAQPALAA
jgi:molecular chaperone IbpA